MRPNPEYEFPLWVRRMLPVRMDSSTSALYVPAVIDAAASGLFGSLSLTSIKFIHNPSMDSCGPFITPVQHPAGAR